MNQDHYLDPYRASAHLHGHAFEVTLWANPDTQALRFQVFTQLYSFAGRRLLDAGCSRGDLAAYLIDQHISFDRYVGVDGVDDVIAFAIARELSNCEFHSGDFLADPALLAIGQPEVVCISGTLNTMTDDQAMAVLRSAWQATSDALLFNFLSDQAKLTRQEAPGPARRLDTIRILRWALSQTGSVIFRQDYFKEGHDATILMRKPAPRGS